MMAELWNLRGLDLFAGLQPHQIDEVLQIVTTTGFKPGEFIFRPGDPRNQLYLLHHGRVKTFVYSQEGQEKIMHIFLPGDAFGDLLLPMDDQDLPWAQALDDVVVSYLDEPAFKRLMQNCHDLFWSLFRYICAHHAADMRRLRNLLHVKASHRLLRALLQLGDQLGQRGAERVEFDLSLTHEELANMIGVARPTVSASMGELRQAGVVIGQGNYLVVDRQAANRFLGR